MSESLESPSKMIVPEGWTLRELGDLFEFKNGVNAGKESYGIGTKFINVMEIIYNEMITSDMIKGSVQITKEQIQLYSVKDGDIIFNRTSETTNEIGLSSVYFGDEDVVFGGFVIRAKPLANDLDRFFKKYCLRSNLVRNQIIKGGQGVVRSNIGQGDLSKIKILVPPYVEQQKIAKILGSIDNVININAKLIIKKVKNKKWLMQQLLTGKKRLKGFDNDWQVNTLSNFLKVYNEKPKEDVDYEIFTSSKSGLMKQSDYYTGSRLVEREQTDYNVLPPGYLTYRSRSDDGIFKFNKNTLGIVGLISGFYPVFTIKNGDVDFVLSLLNFYHKKLTKYSIGTSQLVLSIKALKSASFKLPQLQEQIKIASILTKAEEEIDLLKQKVDKLKEQKKGLMQVLLTGKKRLK